MCYTVWSFIEVHFTAVNGQQDYKIWKLKSAVLYKTEVLILKNSWPYSGACINEFTWIKVLDDKKWIVLYFKSIA